MKRLLQFSLSLFCLIYGQAQTAFQPSDYLLCDDDSIIQDGIADFDLTIKDAEVLQGQNQNDFIVTYHFSSSNANSGINALSSPYTNIANPQTLWVRVEEISSGSFDTTTLVLIVLETPIIPDTDLYVCDENGDGQIQLDFNTMENGYSISYHLTEGDAEQDLNALVMPTTFLEADIPVRLYARAETVDGCFYVVQRALFYGSYVEANSLTPYETCGSGGIGAFFLPIKNDEVTGGESWIVSYHLNQNDAENGLNPLPDNYTNISNPQTIYCRVRNVSCSDVTPLELIVNEGSVPQLNNLPVELLCPLDPGIVDLTSFESQLINNSDSYEFSYYVTQGDMTQNINEILNPAAFNITTDLNEVFIRVTDNVTNCFSFSSIEFNFIGSCNVSCIDGLNIQYCYTTEDDSFIFTSEDGNPLILEFNSGTFFVSGLVPNIRVLDSDGSVLYIGRGEYIGNQIWDLSGLIFQSSGDTITLEINPVGNSVGCDPDIAGLEIWDFDVYCNSSAGVINVQAFLDSNMNSTFDVGESEFSNGYFAYEKNNDGIINTVSSSDGSFFIVPENETDTYDIIFYLYDEYLACYNATPSTFSDVSASVGQNIQLDVPVIENQFCEDLSVHLINYTPPRPGFYFETVLVFENEGFVEITDGSITFQTDLLLDFISVETNPSYNITNAGQGFILDFSNLQPGEVIWATVELYCPPSVSLGTIVSSYAYYFTNENDVYPDNNLSELSQEVVGSYDPNDKIESHGPQIIYSNFVTTDEWLYYTIRFQNLGTAEAVFVRIEDELDAQLDESTFQMLRSSHDYVVTRTGKDVEWFFEDINLPAEQDDSEGSNGFIYFRIKPMAGYALGDIIPNTAAIYFDFNAPVITNTFNTNFVESLSIDDFSNTDFTIYPNPTNDSVTIAFDNYLVNDVTINLIDMQGKDIAVPQLNRGRSIELNVSSLNSGLYFIKVNDGSKTGVQKLIIE